MYVPGPIYPSESAKSLEPKFQLGGGHIARHGCYPNRKQKNCWILSNYKLGFLPTQNPQTPLNPINPNLKTQNPETNTLKPKV